MPTKRSSCMFLAVFVLLGTATAHAQTDPLEPDPLSADSDVQSEYGLTPEQAFLYYDSLLANPQWQTNKEKQELYRAFYLGGIEDFEKTAQRVLRESSDRTTRVRALTWICQLRFARGDYDYIVKLFSENGTAYGRSEYRACWHWLALSYAARGEHGEAVGVWKELLNLNRLTAAEKASYLFGIGEAMEALGRLREAVASYRRVYSIEEETGYGARALLRAGVCCEKLGEVELATLHYYTFLARYPSALGSSLVRERLAELETEAAPAVAATDTLKYRVVLGVFAVRRDGEALLARARGAGFEKATLESVTRGDRTLHLVAAGEYADPRAAARLADRIMRVLPVRVMVTPIHIEAPAEPDTVQAHIDSTGVLSLDSPADSTSEGF